MDENMAIVIIAPLYALICGAVAYCFAYGYHMLRRLDQSATETLTTETLHTPK